MTLPVVKFTKGEEFTQVFLYPQKKLKDMTKQEKIDACYQYACLMFEEDTPISNRSVRECFELNDHQSAVASDDYGLESDCKWTSEYLKSPLRRKIDEITQKAYHKNLVLGCMLVEKFIHIVDPKVNAKVQCHDKDYLLGRFVIVCPDELFTTIDTIATIKDLAPKGKKMDAFMDLLDNLLAPPWKVPF